MVDYSKWKNIEISDDEDEVHPNIDTPSLFRWRHQARVERMEQMKLEHEALEKEKAAIAAKLKSAREKLSSPSEGVDLSALKKELEVAEKEMDKIRKNEEEFRKKEKLTPWNVDTISKEGFAKTVINTKPVRKAEELTDEEKEERMKQFVKAKEPLLKQFGMLRKYDDSKRFLQEHLELVCEETANYLVIWCINLEMEDKHDLMEHVAHQCICMQYVLELSKQLDVDPRACVGSFFSRIQVADPEYKRAFDDELTGFKDRIRRRAKEKLEIALAEAEEEERKARLGPGGLDPVEVFDSLPATLKDCFERQDIPMLQKAIAELPEDEARDHMKRCVDSGLWVPEANKKDEEDTPTAE